MWLSYPLLSVRETDGASVQWRIAACDHDGTKLCSKVYADCTDAAKALLDLRSLVRGLAGEDYYQTLKHWMGIDEPAAPAAHLPAQPKHLPDDLDALRRHLIAKGLAPRKPPSVPPALTPDWMQKLFQGQPVPPDDEDEPS